MTAVADHHDLDMDTDPADPVEPAIDTAALGKGGVCRTCRAVKHQQFRRGQCHRCYERDRREGRIESLDDAAPARHKIEELCAAGWNYRQIARAAGIDRTLIAFIVGGREKINTKTLLRLAMIDPATRDQHAAAPMDKAALKARAAKTWETRKRKARLARAAAQRAKAERLSCLAAEVAASRAARTATAAREATEMALRSDERSHGDTFAGEHLIALLTGQRCDELEDDWRDLAVCAQADPDIFFPEKGGSTREAKRLCTGCPVKDECLAFALDAGERFGIWGGTSERERRAMEDDHSPGRGRLSATRELQRNLGLPDSPYTKTHPRWTRNHEGDTA